MTDKNAATQTANEIAKRCAIKMFADDQTARDLGMNIENVAAGSATISVIVTAKMLNGFKYCHGGIIFTLADSAFAYACNSYNKTTVAAAGDISFLLPVNLDETLTATAVETHHKGRSGIYDVTVTNSQSQIIALFRGKSRTISDKGPLDV